MVGRSKIKGTNQKFDPEFRFLLEIDPTFEDWRVLAAEWYASQRKNDPQMRTYICAFFVRYLHAKKLDKKPVSLFDGSANLPDLWKILELDALSKSGRVSFNCMADLLNWVLRTKLSQPDADGHLVVPAHLRNPFPRSTIKRVGKTSDITLSHVLAIDPRMVHWTELAAEWLGTQRHGVAPRLLALNFLLLDYIVGCDLPRHPMTLLQRSTPKPIFIDRLIRTKKKGAVGSLAKADVKHNNLASDFINWVLTEKLSLEDDHGNRLVPAELHNPVKKLTETGFAAPTETTKSSLSIRYIKELRLMLAEGPSFRDWNWAQSIFHDAVTGGDWFVVDPELVNPDDPDCVWRERDTSKHERGTLKLPSRVTELWSPVRAVAIAVKLELPLRTFQVRMLDSGEADTWRYVHGPKGGSFELNDSPLATGDAKRPYQRGVFHRSANESGSGIFINTNKTADINKAENAKGYVIPWAHETVLHMLDKLRRWQERYNPIQAPTGWDKLAAKHFGSTPPHPEVLASRGTACFLFRDASARAVTDRQIPIVANALVRPWYRLLERLDKRCAERGETLDDGTPMQFVAHDENNVVTHYPLHALRVSLISYLVLDLQLPIAIVSKLIAGHARIIMTLYYTKFGHAWMKEVLDLAERNTLAADQGNHRRFLMDATMDQVSERFASINVDAMHAAIGQKSAAGFVIEDKGICPVGGSMCDVGGERLRPEREDSDYAPVPGYPQERNCTRCRFFLTGPAFLPGLTAHFNTVSYEVHERSERHNDLQEEVTLMERRRDDCARDGRLFTEFRELERVSQRYEAEAETTGKLVNDMQATYHLIGRSLEILKDQSRDGVQLVAVGAMSDIQAGFIETPSELHQIEVLCENAVIYPEIDARKPVLRRSQLLDCMLEFNKMKPVFFRLKPEQQLAAGNAVMQLIQARAGSLKEALDYVEGLRRLSDLGIVDATWDTIAEKVAGTPARQIIDAARKSLRLPGSNRGKNDAS
jgi:hypothetical protein